MIIKIIIKYLFYRVNLSIKNGDWGWGLGIGPIPNPQSPIPIFTHFINKKIKIF